MKSTKMTSKKSYEDKILQDMQGLDNSSRNIYAETLFSASELRPRDTMNVIGGCPVRVGFGY